MESRPIRLAREHVCVQEDHLAELEALKQESEMPLEDLLKTLPVEMFDTAAEAEDKISADQQVECLYLLTVTGLSISALLPHVGFRVERIDPPGNGVGLLSVSVVLLARATFCTVLFCVIFVFCLLVVLVRLSVPVQVIDWKDSSLK